VSTAAQENELVSLCAALASDPLAFTLGAYPWGEGELAGSTGPRAWQTKVLKEIGDHLSGPQRFEPFRLAVASGHGIGKSAEIGMIINWGMSTCDDCRIIVTAGSGAQLQTKTAPEVSKWFRRSITSRWFEVQSTSIRSLTKGHGATWRADYLTWSADNPQAFAGLHNRGKRIIVIFDEASAIADAIWDTVTGALTDEDTEIIFIAFGNPTEPEGRFRECFGKAKHLWHTAQIDSRTVEGTNKAEIATWIELWGEDSDFVRVKVRGEFPRVGGAQFIAPDLVSAARRYRAVGHERMPKIMAVDVARFGDDQTVIGTRQGRKLKVLATFRGQDNMQVAAHVSHFAQQEAPDAIVVDGDGLGAGVVDRLKQLGHGKKLTEFHGGQAAHNGKMYFNRRAEVWGLMREALKNGLEIPDDPMLEQELVGPRYGMSGKDQIQLERKDEMKSRGLGSPDIADMAAMTFAVEVAVQREKPKPTVYQFAGQQALGWMG
jgi:hypothetical protein